MNAKITKRAIHISKKAQVYFLALEIRQLDLLSINISYRKINSSLMIV